MKERRTQKEALVIYRRFGGLASGKVLEPEKRGVPNVFDSGVGGVLMPSA